MTFGTPRKSLEPGKWTQISTTEDSNVTIENFGVDAYQFVQIVSGPTEPSSDTEVANYRTIRAQRSQTFTNLDEGTVLWARALAPVVIEVLTG